MSHCHHIRLQPVMFQLSLLSKAADKRNSTSQLAHQDSKGLINDEQGCWTGQAALQTVPRPSAHCSDARHLIMSACIMRSVATSTAERSKS